MKEKRSDFQSKILFHISNAKFMTIQLELRAVDPTATYIGQRYASEWKAMSDEAKLAYSRKASQLASAPPRKLSKTEIQKQKDEAYKKVQIGMKELYSLGIQTIAYHYDVTTDCGGWIHQGTKTAGSELFTTRCLL